MAGRVRIAVNVNGRRHEASVEPRLLLVHFLRENLGLTGTHIGCDTTNCGACAVLLDGKAVKSCSVLAVQADGREVLTVEGLTRNGEPHPIQESFIAKHGLQCGFCTPGMVMTTYALLRENPDPTEGEIVAGLSGNLCRCTGYAKVIDSVKLAARSARTASKKASRNDGKRR